MSIFFLVDITLLILFSFALIKVTQYLFSKRMDGEGETLQIFPGENITDVRGTDFTVEEGEVLLNISKQYLPNQSITFTNHRAAAPFIRGYRLGATLNAGCVSQLNTIVDPNNANVKAYLCNTIGETVMATANATVRTQKWHDENAMTAPEDSEELYGMFFRTSYQGIHFYEQFLEKTKQTFDTTHVSGVRELLGTCTATTNCRNRIIYDFVRAANTRPLMLQTMRAELPTGACLVGSKSVINDKTEKGQDLMFFLQDLGVNAVSLSSLFAFSPTRFTNYTFQTHAMNVPFYYTPISVPAHVTGANAINFTGSMDNEIYPICVAPSIDVAKNKFAEDTPDNYAINGFGNSFLAAFANEFRLTSNAQNNAPPSLYFDPTYGTNVPFADFRATTVNESNPVAIVDNPRILFQKYEASLKKSYETESKKTNSDVDHGYDQNRFAYGARSTLGLPTTQIGNKSLPKNNTDSSLNAVYKSYMRELNVADVAKDAGMTVAKPLINKIQVAENFDTCHFVMDNDGAISLNALQPKYDVCTSFESTIWNGDTAFPPIAQANNSIANFTGVAYPMTMDDRCLTLAFTSVFDATVQAAIKNEEAEKAKKPYGTFEKATLDTYINPQILWRGMYNMYLVSVDTTNAVLNTSRDKLQKGLSGQKAIYLGDCVARTGTPLYTKLPPSNIIRDIKNRVGELATNDASARPYLKETVGAGHGALHSIVHVNVADTASMISHVYEHEQDAKDKRIKPFDYDDWLLTSGETTSADELNTMVVAPAFAHLYAATLYNTVYHHLLRHYGATANYKRTDEPTPSWHIQIAKSVDADKPNVLDVSFVKDLTGAPITYTAQAILQFNGDQHFNELHGDETLSFTLRSYDTTLLAFYNIAKVELDMATGRITLTVIMIDGDELFEAIEFAEGSQDFYSVLTYTLDETQSVPGPGFLDVPVDVHAQNAYIERIMGNHDLGMDSYLSYFISDMVLLKSIQHTLPSTTGSGTSSTTLRT